jgi:hypothetical protein
MLQFEFTGKDTIPDEMVVHFDVLCSCVEYEVFMSWMLLRLSQ